jgi:hypothetical protein
MRAMLWRYGKRLARYARFVRVGMVLIVLIGVARFAAGVMGVPYERATHLLSITITTMVLAVVYGARAAAAGFGGYRHLLPMAVTLALAMYGFIVAAILVEGLGGIHGYFHAPGRGLAPGGMSVLDHIGGQLLAMTFSIGPLWLLAAVGFALSRYLYFLRPAVLILVAVAAAWVAAGLAGVPNAIGTWVTSLTLVAMLLALYYGYRARAQGFTRLGDVTVLGIVIAAALGALMIYAIAVTTGTRAPTRGHLQLAVAGIVVMIALSAIGFALGKRQAALAGAGAR